MSDGHEQRPVRERDLDPVPKIPRSKSMRWMWNDLFRIAFLVLMLVTVIVMKDHCASGVGKFIGSFEPVDAGPAEAPIEAPPGWELVPADQVDIEKMFPTHLDAGPPSDAGPARDATAR